MKWLALLQGVNVGGNNMLSMAQLRTHLTDLGLGNVKTLLATGNVIFETDQEDASALESMLEREILARLKFQTDFLVRSRDELAEVITANPFPEVARERPSQLVVAFGRAPASRDLPEKLSASYDGPERLAIVGREMYVDFPDGQARSALWTEIATLGHSGVGTGRNWNTVGKLHAAMQD